MMTELSINIPDSIYNGVQALAAKENVSIDQLVTLALMTEDYLSKRAKRGNRDKFLAVLNAAPDVEPIEDDRIG